ncbi:MAG TPA: FtsX-like permease family protein [Phycisphaerae bacterium]|nr:FtsX-like permease family protein [Phycisphaerae bacterium]HON65520.1 FtsX-like permease family protein [Phycisphaerae bacterium]HOQ85363.1 FtsX-like permease family protein [Phycisphaerae bacterium]HPP25615.1 FtsX-like permease family protein [Phycisphaerae bacterium]HPU28373.1 FtsX-like permease family protein [Phycisphaerae bacterium]
MYKLFLCLRYLRRRRIAFLSVAAVCLCTAMVLIVVSVMNGFLQMVRDRSRGMLADLIIENQTLQGFPFYQEFIDLIKTDPVLADRIEEATPVIISYGILRFPSDQITKPAQIVGIRLDETCRVNDFAKGLFYNKYYPGTTHLGPQQEPHFGRDDKGRYVLPPELEEARRRWQGSASERDQKEARQNVSKIYPYPGPGFYWPMPGALYDPSIPLKYLDPVPPSWQGPELPGAIIGTDMVAKRLPDGSYERAYYPRGSTVTLTFVPFTDTGKPLESGTGMPSKVFRYVDDHRTGVYDIDSMSVYVDFDLLQDVLEMDPQKLSEDDPHAIIPARTTQVQIKLTPEYFSDPKKVLETRDLLRAKWNEFILPRLAELRTPELVRRVRIVTWEEKQATYIGAVEKEKYLVTSLISIVSMVAVLLVVCIFYMIVQQKTRDIGIIKSVGATSFGVAQIFLSYGAAVGAVGGGMGIVLGVLFVKYINEIQDGLKWLGEKFNRDLQVWNPEVYAFDRIPNQVESWDVVIIYGVAVLMSVLGSVIAAYQASRVWPVEALRYE